MTLGDYIAAYRHKENLSQREFAKKCHLSNGYISMLERGFNHKTKEPIKPALPQIKKLADGMGISVMALFESVEDMPVDISFDYQNQKESSTVMDFFAGKSSLSPNQIASLGKHLPTERESKILEAFRSKSPAEQQAFLTLLGISED